MGAKAPNPPPPEIPWDEKIKGKRPTSPPPPPPRK